MAARPCLRVGGGVESLGHKCCSLLPHPHPASALATHPFMLPCIRYTWLAAKQEQWTPQRHRLWPPRFQAAVRHLLLLHHTGRAGSGDSDGSSGPLTRGKRARLDLVQRRITPEYLGPVASVAAAAAVRKPAAAEPAVAAQPAAAAAGKACVGKAAGRPVQPRGLKRGRAAAGALGEPREISPLASLPKELLLRIIGEAAYPISAWV